MLDGVVKALQLMELLRKSVAMSGQRVRRKRAVKLEQDFHAAIVQLRGVLDARDQRRESTLSTGCHRIGSRQVQRAEDCNFDKGTR